MQSNIKHHIELHFIVLIYGFTAILGKVITLDAQLLVAWRMGITVAALLILMVKSGRSIIPKTSDAITYIFTGIIVALHWITFFGAIKMANVSVALGGLASTTLFVSILEPLIMKRKFMAIELIIGILIITGLYVIFSFETRYTDGLVIALTSAFLAALFTVINKLFTQKHTSQPLAIGFFELTGGALAVIIYILITGTGQDQHIMPTPGDWIWLLLLAVVCTAYPYIATIRLMHHLSAYKVTLAVNMEPIYGILLAYLCFGSSELMTTGFYIGASIIIVSVVAYPILLRKTSGIKTEKM